MNRFDASPIFDRARAPLVSQRRRTAPIAQFVPRADLPVLVGRRRRSTLRELLETAQRIALSQE